MSARTILNVETPTTQSLDAIKALLSWRGRAGDPLPSFIEMGKEESRLVLVLSNKKDAYYCVTAKRLQLPGCESIIMAHASIRENTSHRSRSLLRWSPRASGRLQGG